MTEAQSWGAGMRSGVWVMEQERIAVATQLTPPALLRHVIRVWPTSGADRTLPVIAAALVLCGGPGQRGPIALQRGGVGRSSMLSRCPALLAPLEPRSSAAMRWRLARVAGVDAT